LTVHDYIKYLHEVSRCIRGFAVIDEVLRDIYLRFALNYTVPVVHVNGEWDCVIGELAEESTSEKKERFLRHLRWHSCRHKDIKSYLANGRRLWHSFESLLVACMAL